ncbi:T48 [Tupaiid betaherpesvirus 1]|uniref:T48 n=1 Tax=Tupaiid herpesvirus 1 (strain 1) TaxID=10397 RepID=Q91TP1_TUHV1|nr:T48 [Tupaiid betaherpesvirus 1]AAK57096.1 T48 [Tupaiid betaherpesvirus 1]
MKIHRASRDQSDPRYGARAGSQCMSNCFAYLQAAFLGGVANTLGTETLDAVLEAGSRIDTLAEQRLKSRTAGPLPLYRLGDEIPTHLTTSFGETDHMLSRPFNGTTETRDLDGYACLGIYDFLRYAGTKNRPLFVIATVGVLTRALVLAPRHTFVFDPHATDRSDRAAVYECEQLDEVIAVLSGFGTTIGTFYYDAAFVYFVRRTAGIDSSRAAEAVIIDLYKDPDLPLPTEAVQALAAAAAAAADSTSTSTPATTAAPSAPRPQSRSPLRSPLRSPRQSPPRSPRSPRRRSPSRSPPRSPATRGGPARRRAKSTPRTPRAPRTPRTPRTPRASQARARRAPPIQAEELLPTLQRYTEAIESFERAIAPYLIQGPPTAQWLLYATDGSSFETSFVSFRLHQLLAHALNHLTRLPAPGERVDRSRYVPFAELLGYSPELDDFLRVLRQADLNLVYLYHLYLHPRPRLSDLDQLLLTKVLTVCRHWSPQHGPAVRKWVDALCRLDVPSGPDAAATVRTAAQRSPFPVSTPFTCLSPDDVDVVKSQIRQKAEALRRLDRRHRAVYQELVRTVTDLHPTDPDEGRDDADARLRAAAEAVDWTALPPAARSHLQTVGARRVRELLRELQDACAELLRRSHNQIVTGTLPSDELHALLERTEQTLQLLEALERREVLRADSAAGERAGLRDLRDNLGFLLAAEDAAPAGGAGSTNPEPPPPPSVSQEVRALRSEYRRAREQHRQLELRAEDLLRHLEELVQSDEHPPLTLRLAEEQLAQLARLPLDSLRDGPARVDRVRVGLLRLRRQHHDVRQLVRGLCYDALLHHKDVKAYAALQPALAADEPLRRDYEERLRRIYGDLSERLVQHDPPPETLFHHLDALIGWLPPETPAVAPLRLANQLLERLTRRLRALAGGKNELSALNELVDFFVAHDRELTELVRGDYGRPLPRLYESLLRRLERLLEERREQEWLQEARQRPVASAADLEAFLQTAPTRAAAERAWPELHARLQKHLEAERRREGEDRERAREELKRQVADTLARLVRSVQSPTPSLSQNLALPTVAGLLAALDAEDAGPLLETFNLNLAAALEKLRAVVQDAETQTVRRLLRAGDAEPAELPPRLSAARELLQSLDTTYTDLLSAETARQNADVLDQLRVLQRLHDGGPHPFRETPYEQAHVRYLTARRVADERCAEQTRELAERADALQREILDGGRPGGGGGGGGGGGASATAAARARYTLTRPPFLSDTEKRQVQELPPPFAEALQEYLRDLEARLTDECAAQNGKLRSLLELQEAKRQSVELRWQDLLNHHKLEKPEHLDLDQRKLHDDPVGALQQLLRRADEQPYSAAEQTLRWAAAFVRDVLRDLHPDPAAAEHRAFRVLDGQTREKLAAVTRQLETNAACESLCLLLEKPPVDDAQVEAFERALAQLESGRVAGGEPRYRYFLDLLRQHRDRSRYVERYEQLQSRYRTLRRDLRVFAYGFDFGLQRAKIAALRAEFQQLPAPPPAPPAGALPAVGAEVGPGGPPDTEAEDETPVPPAAFAAALDALERAVLHGQTYLDNLLAAQSLVGVYAYDLPIYLPAPSSRPRLDAQRDLLTRLQLAPEEGTYYQVLDAFGRRRLVTAQGVPVDLTLGYGNAVIKYSFLFPDESLSTKRQIALDQVTARYKALAVATALGQTFRAFWDDICGYDLRALLTNEPAADGAARRQLDERVRPLVNLKLYLYVLFTAWTTVSDGRGRGRGARPAAAAAAPPAWEITPLELATVVTALAPEYLYGCVKNPVSTSLRSLVLALDPEEFTSALSQEQNPPRLPIWRLRAYGLDPERWPEVQLRRLLWDSDFVRQICGPRRWPGVSVGLGKLFQYQLAVRILPAEVLQCVWSQLKPRYAQRYGNLFEFVRALHRVCLTRYRVEHRPPAPSTATVPPGPPTLPTGERVWQVTELHRQPDHDDRELTTFLKTETALDYVLGSYVFNVPLTCCLYVSDLFGRRRLLLARHLENVPDDVDFQRIVKARDLNLGYTLTRTWSDNVLEHSWFQVQLRKLRQHLERPPDLGYVPLVIYSGDDHSVLHCLQPPEKPDPAAAAPRLPLRFTFTHPFGTFPIDDGDDAEHVVAAFSRTPISTDFLQAPPPPLYPPSRRAGSPASATDDDSRPASLAGSEESSDEERPRADDDEASPRRRPPARRRGGERRVPAALGPEDGGRRRDAARETSAAEDSIRTDVLSDPLFEQRPISSLMPRDDVLTLSPQSRSPMFLHPPGSLLTQRLTTAIRALRRIREDLDGLTEHLRDSFRRLRIVYLQS